MFRSFTGFTALVLFYSSASILTLHASVGTESWRQDLGEEIHASPVVRDLDGDGDYEILISSRFHSLDENWVATPGQVHLLDHQGLALHNWPQQIEVDTDAAVFPLIEISPSVGDIDGDGELEVVVGDDLGYLHAWEIDGTAKPFPASGRSDNRLSLDGGIKAVVRLIDVDQDGADELLVHTGTSKLYLLNSDGSDRDGWPVDLGGAVENLFSNRPFESSPLALDFDIDGTMEIAVATTGGEVHFYDIDGNLVWEVSTTSPDDQHFSSLVAVDLDGDYQLELVLAGADQKLHAWHADGTLVDGFPTQLLDVSVVGSVAVANLHSEPGPELVVTDVNGKVYCFSNAGVKLWDTLLPLAGQPGHSNASPIIVDILNDGSHEIVVPSLGNYLWVLSATGDIIGYIGGARASQWSTPVCANIDSDSNLELLYIHLTGEALDEEWLACYQLNTSGDHAINSAAFGWNGFLGDRGELSNGPTGDLDSDLMPDRYELDYLKTTAFGRDDDNDGDKSTNYDEFVAVTNPADSNDYLRFSMINIGEGEYGPVYDMTLRMKAGRTYEAVQSKDLNGEWTTALNEYGTPWIEECGDSDRTILVTLPIDTESSKCFYSVRVSITD